MARLPRVPAAKANYLNHVTFAAVEFDFNAQGDGAIQTEIMVPAGAVFLQALSGVQVEEAFDGTTPTVAIGYKEPWRAGAEDADAYLAASAVTAKGFTPFDADAMKADTRREITVTVAGTGSTAGSGMVIIAMLSQHAEINQV